MSSPPAPRAPNLEHARKLAWTLYLLKTEQLINEQYEPWSQGHPVGGIHLSAPSEKSVKHMARFLDAAFKDGQLSVVHEALSNLVESIDAIDNSKPKSAALKACRAGLQKSYDALHAIKDRIEAAPADV